MSSVTMSGTSVRVDLSRWVGVAMAFLLVGIHLAMAPDHLSEKLYIGVLFVIGSGLLALVICGLAASDWAGSRRAAWYLGILVCAGMFVGFLISRTFGLPLGYLEEWTGTEGALGIVSLVAEFLFIVAGGTALTAPTGHDHRTT